MGPENRFTRVESWRVEVSLTFLFDDKETPRLQSPLFDLDSLIQTLQHLTWRERIKASFGYNLLECPRCGCIMQLAEIWEPKRGHIWMRRWLETHRMRKTARQALERIRAQHRRYRQLAFDFNFET